MLLLAVPSLAQQQVVHQGKWTAKGFDVDGTWKIIRDGGKTFVVLDDAFNTKSAPDLKIFLSPNAASGLDNRNATQGSALVAVLQSNRGAQRYEVPAGVDVSRYRAIVIHCEKYTKLWAAAYAATRTTRSCQRADAISMARSVSLAKVRSGMMRQRILKVVDPASGKGSTWRSSRRSFTGSTRIASPRHSTGSLQRRQAANDSVSAMKRKR
jgi:hypothetical protein